MNNITIALIERVCKYVELGLSNEQAAVRAGITRGTFYRWRKKGRELTKHYTDLLQRYPETEIPTRDSLYIMFGVELEKAKAKAEEGWLALVNEAARGRTKLTETRQRTETGPDGEVRRSEETTITKETTPQWTAAAWLLERKFGDRWGKRFAADLNMKGDVTHHYDPNELEQAAKELEDWKRERASILDESEKDKAHAVDSAEDHS